MSIKQESSHENLSGKWKGLSFVCSSMLIIGCASGGAPSEGTGGSGVAATSLLDPPPAGQGIQYKMVSTLDPGQEVERVQFFQVPKEGLYVNREETRYSLGSHHVLIYKTPYSTIPTQDVHGHTVDTSGVIDAPNGGTTDWEIDGVVAGAQSSDAPAAVSGLPSNVALKLEGGAVLLMNTHYLNATSAPLRVEARINLWTIPAAQATVEAGILFFYDPIIRLPAHSRSYAEMSCPVHADIHVVNLQTHMHRRGLGGQAFVLPPGGGTPALVYTSSSWEAVNVERFNPAMNIKAGSQIDYHCDYFNAEASTVLQGLSTKDEMCMLVGLYYPKDAKTELCSPDGSFDNLSMAGTWMGKGGNADCMASINCLGQADSDDAAYQCILDACPSVAKRFNDTFKCMGASQEMCSHSCAGDPKPKACASSCVQKACSTELTACGAAACQ